jgi:cytochrome c oxidase assembly protein subunit 15
MVTPVVSPRAYERVTLVAAWSLAAIILTGAVVRLTGSGLGCPDWPSCQQDRLVAEWSLHPMVEFVNRVITGLVSVAVILAVLGSLARVPRRRDLVWLSVSLVAGVIGQIVLGGITVLTDLNPVAVQGHFVLSMAILAAAVVLHRRAGEDGPYRPTVTGDVRRLAWIVTGLAAIAIATGTIVTGTGPHGGDENAHRFGFQITSVARIHSGTVILTVIAALVLAYVAHRDQRDWDAVNVALTTFVWVAVFQGVVGYTQYFNNVPAGLVAVHVVGAVAVWVSALRLTLACRAGCEASVDDAGPRGRDVALLGVDHLDQDPVEADGLLEVGEILQPRLLVGGLDADRGVAEHPPEE